MINWTVSKFNISSLKIPVTKLKRQATKRENISTKHVCIRLDKMLNPEYIKLLILSYEKTKKKWPTEAHDMDESQMYYAKEEKKS